MRDYDFHSALGFFSELARLDIDAVYLRFWKRLRLAAAHKREANYHDAAPAFPRQVAVVSAAAPAAAAAETVSTRPTGGVSPRGTGAAAAKSADTACRRTSSSTAACIANALSCYVAQPALAAVSALRGLIAHARSGLACAAAARSCIRYAGCTACIAIPLERGTSLRRGSGRRIRSPAAAPAAAAAAAAGRARLPFRASSSAAVGKRYAVAAFRYRRIAAATAHDRSGIIYTRAARTHRNVISSRRENDIGHFKKAAGTAAGRTAVAALTAACSAATDNKNTR